MAKFLLATLPFVGHVAPMIPVARQLVERGHSVIWYASRFFQAKIEATGAKFAPMIHALDYGDADYSKHFPKRTNYQGLAQIKFDFKHLFIDAIAGQLQDLQAILQDFPADVLLGDPAVVAIKILGDRERIPWAYLNVSVLSLASRDVPPFGLGLLPAYSKLGRMRNAALYALSDRLIFAEVQQYFNQLATKIGFTPFRFAPTASPWLYLQPSIPKFEYVRTDLPPTVHFIGPLIPDASPDFNPPDWWHEVIAAEKPIILVTQGTIATNTQQLIEPTLQALADEDLLAIATTGDNSLNEVPANARIASFIPFANIMPYVSAYITNGGFGGVTIALSYGVPIISGGTTEDKAEVSSRIAYAGVGINLRTATPKPQQIRNAVKKILSSDRYRQKAQQMQAEFAGYNAASQAAQLLEELARTQKPVYASLPKEALSAGWQHRPQA